MPVPYYVYMHTHTYVLIAMGTILPYQAAVQEQHILVRVVVIACTCAYLKAGIHIPLTCACSTYAT